MQAVTVPTAVPSGPRLVSSQTPSASAYQGYQILRRNGAVVAFEPNKIAVALMKAFLAVQKEFGSFSRYVWRFVGGKPLLNRRRSLKDIPARTPESDAMSEDLKKRGFKFVGSTICYAHMQATGMVNDHVTSCFRHRPLAKTR